MSDLAFYDPMDEAVLPSAARQVWAVTGAGGVLQTNNRLRITGTSAVNRYVRAPEGIEPPTRLEVQASFEGITNGATISGHMLVADDGERSVGVAIGNELAFVDPSDGSRILTIAESWGFTRENHYHLVKRRTASWDVYVNGRLLKRLPYEAAAAPFLSSPGTGFGWWDSGSSGSGDWRLVESGVDITLPPQWLVDRLYASMPVPLREAWTRRHTALLRAMAGTTETSMDQARGSYELHTAALLELEETAWPGDEDPVLEGWTETSSGALAFPDSAVRDRRRLTGQAQDDGWRYTFTTPENPSDMVIRLKARVYLRAHATVSNVGRIGPFLELEDGNRVIRILMLHSGEAHEALGWQITTGDLSGSDDLGIFVGEDLHLCDPYQQEGTEVEAYIVGRTRVILFVDGQLVEDVPYTSFAESESSSAYAVQVGVAGDADFTATVDFEDVEADVSFADLRQRPEFLQRLQERLLFVGGCERNDRLDVWSQHRFGVFQSRGTQRAIYEVRRIACDDSAQVVTQTVPSEWYIERTYPEVTPIFLESDDIIVSAAAEYQANSPNLEPAQLKRVLEKYILPRSLVEARFNAYLATVLSSSTVTTTTTAFTVLDPTGFEAGDQVELRGDATNGADTPDLELTYDVDADRTAAAADLEDQSGNGNDGTIGTGASWATDDSGTRRDDTSVQADTPSTTGGNVTISGFTPDLSGGEVTICGWYRWLATSGDYLWSTQSLLTDGNTRVRVIGSGEDVSVEFRDAANVEDTTTFSGALTGRTAGDWFHVCVVLSVTANTYTLYVDGVQVGSPTTLSITPATPSSSGFRFGGQGGQTWLHDYKDMIVWNRALSAAEVLAVYNGRRVEGARAPDSDGPVCYLAPRGYPHALLAYEPQPHQAELVQVAARNGHVWAAFEVTADGQVDRDTPAVTKNYAGLLGDKSNDITPGEVVNVSGGSNYTATIYGLDDSDVPAIEEIEVTSGGPATGSQLWNEVHGVTIDPVQVGAVDVDDDSDSDLLYQVSALATGSGVVEFDPPIRVHNGQDVRLETDAAAANAIVEAHVYGDTVKVLEADFASGTDPQDLGTLVDVRTLALGYITGGANITVTPGLALPGGTMRVVSSNAADDQTIRCVFLDETGALQHEDLVLNGTTGVTGTLNTLCFLGAFVVGDTLPAGNITVQSYEGALLDIVTLGTITAASTEEGVGVRRTRLDLTPSTGLELKLEAASSRPHQVALAGLDADGAVQVQVVQVEDVEWLDVPGTWSRLDAVCVANLPIDTWVRVRGTMWRFNNMNAALLGLDGSDYWTAATDIPADDARLDDDRGQDAALNTTITLSADGSKFEATTITSIDQDTGDVVTPALTESFDSFDTMRKVG